MNKTKHKFVTALEERKLRREAFKRRRVWFYPLIAVIVFAIVYVVFRIVGLSISEYYATIDVAGQFGDSFGYVNALFSSLAFAGVILALFVQIAEFHLAQEERDEALETQQTISTQQYFSSVITAVSTWSQLHGARPIPHWSEWKHLHLDYFVQRKTTSVLLSVATDYLLTESLGESDNVIRSFQNDRRMALARRDSEISRDLLYIVLDKLFVARKLVNETVSTYSSTKKLDTSDFAVKQESIASLFRQSLKLAEEGICKYEWAESSRKTRHKVVHVFKVDESVADFPEEDRNIASLVIRIWTEIDYLKTQLENSRLVNKTPMKESPRAQSESSLQNAADYFCSDWDMSCESMITDILKRGFDMSMP